MSKATDDVLTERKRQVEQEGWTAKHDDQHTDGDLALAAACYACNAATWAAKGTDELRKRYAELSRLGFHWPWDQKWWKPKSQRQDLVRAAALLIAEIERLDRRDAGLGSRKHRRETMMDNETRAVCERLLKATDIYFLSDMKEAKALDQARVELRALLDKPVAQPMTEGEIEKLAVEHEAFGFGLVDAKGCTTHGFDPEGIQAFARAVEAHHHIGEKTK